MVIRVDKDHMGLSQNRETSKIVGLLLVPFKPTSKGTLKNDTPLWELTAEWGASGKNAEDSWKSTWSYHPWRVQS